MATWHDYYRLGAAQALAVASAGGAASSSTVFGTMTRAIRLVWNGATSTSGIRYAIVDPRDFLDDGSTVACQLDWGRQGDSRPTRLGYQQRRGHAIHQHHRVDGLMRDAKWIRDLQPDEARAALAALDRQEPPDTVRGILEMRAMRQALMAKAEKKRPPVRGRWRSPSKPVDYRKSYRLLSIPAARYEISHRKEHNDRDSADQQYVIHVLTGDPSAGLGCAFNNSIVFDVWHFRSFANSSRAAF
jgi:hypothetical protein